MEKQKKHLKMIELYPEIKDMIEQIKKECPDLRTDTATILYSIRFTCEKMIPDYIKIQRERIKNYSPEEKIKRQVDMKVLKEEYKEEVAVDKGRRTCELLDGEIDDKDMCTYSTYMFINKNNIQKGSITLPVETLSDKDVLGQYKKFDGTNISKEEFNALQV